MILSTGTLELDDVLPDLEPRAGGQLDRATAFEKPIMDRLPRESPLPLDPPERATLPWVYA